MACDIDPSCRKTYETNYNMKPLGNVCDINPQDIESFDVLCSGFPCQPFSQAGKQKGFDDERGQMIYQTMKFIDAHHPACVILENVQGFLSHNKGKTFLKIKSMLENKNYVVFHKVLKCSDYGIPQMRKRLFIVCLKRDLVEQKNICFNDIFDLREFEKNTNLSDYLNLKLKKDIAYTIRCGGRNSPIKGRHNWDGYFTTDGKVYRLSLNDAKKLQGFEDEFILCGTQTQKWKQLGNTIPTVFTKMIGEKLNKIFI